MAITVSKIVGAGNDFLFIDARDGGSIPAPAAETRPALAEKLCDRHFGVGSDGLVFVESFGGDLRWDFYNNDGSHAEMCGNASRCMGRWAQRKLGLTETVFHTAAGRVRTQIEGDEIASYLDYVSLEFKELAYEARGKSRRATLVNTGVPHAVVEIGDIKNARAAVDDIRALRNHPGAGPRGTNVTFVQTLAPGDFATVTFERGVEDFTLSCGTGVLAAAAVALRSGATNARMAKVSTPGGRLEVSYGQNWSGAVLKGPALFLFDLPVTEELLR